MLYRTAKQTILKLSVISALHTWSTYENYSKEILNFPSYQQLRALAYVQGSKFADNYVKDQNNLNTRQNREAKLEYIQDVLST